ncbi:MAG: hypothetical protein ACLGHX_12950 [Acidimicrobiia bacterium]
MTGVVDRLMRASVSIAGRMQPRKALRQADDAVYSSPLSREAVETIRSAGRRLIAAGLGVNGLAVIAWRRSAQRIGVTGEGADLSALGPGDLSSMLRTDSEPGSPAVEAVRAGAGAAVWAHPVMLLALGASGRTPDLGVGPLVSRMGTVGLAGTGSFDVTVFPGEGVLAVGDDPVDAVSRLEAAERLAAIQRGVDP